MELLERGTFLDALDEYAAAAANGSGRTVLLAGDAGIGKTSLVEVFRDQRPDLRWLWGACDASFTPRPLGPLHEIASTVGGPLRELTRPGGDRGELFAAFLDLLASSATPTAVVVEDLHWADEATLDWVSHLARRVGRTPAMLIVTYRPTEAAGDPRSAAALGRLSGHGSTRRILLPALSATAVGSVAHTHGRDAGRLLRLTGGNPFYLHEVLADPDVAVPASVADVVRARVLRHSPAAQRLLAAAAVLARPAPTGLVAAVAGVAAATVDECVTSGTLVVGDAGVGFAHELTRLAVEEALPAHRAAELHRAAYTLLARQGADDARLAHHAERAGDPAATLRHATAAAAEAARLHSHREAVVQHERALAAAARTDADDATRADLLEGLASVHALTDQWEEAAAANDHLVELRRRLGDTSALSRALRQRFTCSWRLCRGAEAAAAAADSWALMADQPDSAERAWSLAVYARSGPADADATVVRAAAEEAVRLGAELDEPDLLAYALQVLGIHKVSTGDDGFGELERAFRVASNHGNEDEAVRALVNRYELSVDQLRLHDSDWMWEEGTRRCEEHELQTYTHCLSAVRAQVLLRRGAVDEAVALAERTLDRPMSGINRAHLRIPQLTGQVRRGTPGVLERLHEARRLAVETGDACWLLPLESAVCEVAWLAGDPSLVDAGVLDTYAATATVEPWLRAGLAAGLARLGLLGDPPLAAPSPYREEIEGDHAAAAAAWWRLGCPYEAAVALASCGQEAQQRDALQLFLALDAEPAAMRVRRDLRVAGARSVARGPRRTTRAHPAGLTAREAEVVEHLAAGRTNAEIADRLVLSPRTVDRHVSSVLAKLGVTSRREVAGRAQPG